MKASQRGFTLIELMITVAIVAVLAAVALPSYTNHLRKGARTSAKAEMMDIANRQQQYLLANRSYASSLSELNYNLTTETSGRYNCAIATVASPPSFTITCTPKGSQAQGDDVQPLTLDSSGGRSPAKLW